MKRFTQLYLQLDQTTKTLGKTAAIERYFREAPPADAAWAIYFLSGRKLRQVVPTKRLRQWVMEVSGIEEWLFDECYAVVGDLAETMALLLPQVESSTDVSLAALAEALVTVRSAPVDEQRAQLVASWKDLNAAERFVFHKLITAEFRVGVSQGILIRGLARASRIDPETLAHRMMGDWEPSETFYRRLIDPDTTHAKVSRPYPFFLAHPIDRAPEELLGDVADWIAEWKWDGIRATLIVRENETYIWSRGEELVTDRFPEIAEAARVLPNGTVLDGELVGWRDGRVLPFAALQRRIGRKNLTKRIRQEVPVVLIAFDCLEADGQDIRGLPLSQRRQRLEQLLLSESGDQRDPRLMVSPVHRATDWNQLHHQRSLARERGAEGLMLKRANSPYRVGRPRGDWWKWKVDPYTVDAVLIYAQPGNGRRASLYTDYTFGVWNNDALVPFAKAYSGLTDEEIRRVDRFVRQNTLEQFGPVRSVKPELVFELAFEDIRLSSRHKSGVAVRFPRIVRWRADKDIREADSLDTIKAMLPVDA